MLVSDDEEMLFKARFWATQARNPAPHYQHSEIGYNYRLSNILAAVGRPQLQEVEARVQKRRDIFERYKEDLGSNPGVDFMPEATYGRANRWLTVMTLDPKLTGLKPIDIINALEEHNIESRPVWKPMHLQPIFEKYPFFTAEKNKSFGEKAFETGLCLPSGTNLIEEDQHRIIELLSQTLENPGL